MGGSIKTGCVRRPLKKKKSAVSPVLFFLRVFRLSHLMDELALGIKLVTVDFVYYLLTWHYWITV